MTALIEPVARLIEALSRLPGVGPKTAQRLTYHLLRAPDTEARALAAALIAVRDEVVFCERCFNISTGPLCPICATRRVTTTASASSRSRSTCWRSSAPAPSRAATTCSTAPSRPWTASGRSGCGSASSSTAWLSEPTPDGRYEEVVLATNPTLEGEATAMYLAERLGDAVGVVSRIARGIPVGGDLEYADEVTLVRALQGRQRARGPVRP